MNLAVLISCLLILVKNTDLISIKYRRWCSPWKFCSLSSWNAWSACDRTCGGGRQTRYRQMCSLPVMDFTQHVAMCDKKLSDFVEYKNCSQTCSEYGNWSHESNKCVCDDASIAGRCCTIGK